MYWLARTHDVLHSDNDILPGTMKVKSRIRSTVKELLVRNEWHIIIITQKILWERVWFVVSKFSMILMQVSSSRSVKIKLVTILHDNIPLPLYSVIISTENLPSSYIRSGISV